MTLRVGRGAKHDHRGWWLVCLVLAAAALILPAAGAARATAPNSTGSHSGADVHWSPTVWSFAGRPFSSRADPVLITVNSPADALPSPTECSGAGGDCSLRQAIDKASDGDEIVLLQDTYTVTLGTLLVDKSISIVGPGTTAVIDGSGNVDPATHQLSRIMKIGSGRAVTIDNVSFTGGVDDNDENSSNHAIATVSLNGGGAIFNNGGDLTLSGVRFFDNAQNNPIGGAVATTGGSLTMADVAFDGNQAAVGGSLRIRSGTVTGTTVTFRDSFGEFGGGTIYIDSGSLSLSRSTIDGSSGLNGFGIGIQNAGGNVALTNVTIAHSQGYALMADLGASTTVTNTIIGLGGRGGDCYPANRSDSVINATTGPAVTSDGGYNLDQTGDCNLTGANAHDLTGDPLLTSPGFFGGVTATDAVLPGSPAIDAGNDTAFLGSDQRGIPKFGDHSDIGAFEYVAGAHASFTYAPTNPIDSGGDNGAFVTFTNTSSTTNDATLSYFWDFGDGTTASGASPGHGFAAPDHPTTYTVTLQVTDSAGSVDQTSQDITARPANEKPTASFAFGPAVPNTPTHFDASASSDPDGSIASYDWNWGDDSNNSSGPDLASTTHTYASAGTFLVTLTVTDNGGRTDEVSQYVTVATQNVTDYFVDANWSSHENGDTVAGPEGQELTFGTDAFATIGDALFAANQGQPDSTIHVAAGTYFEEGSLSLQQDGDQLIGAGSDVTHVHLPQLSVDGTGQVVRAFDLIGPGSWGEGTCSGCTSPVVRLGGDQNSDDEDISQNALIQDNRISGGSQGIAFSSGIGDNFPTSGSAAVRNEIFHNTTAVYVDSGSGNLIVNNAIHDTGDVNASPVASVLIIDSRNRGAAGNIVSGNTIENSINHGISVHTSGNTIENNAISESGTSYPAFREPSGIELVSASGESVDNNVITGNSIIDSAFAGIKIGATNDSSAALPDSNVISGNTITGTRNGGRNGSSQDPGAGGTAILLTGGGATNTEITGNTLGPNSGHGILQEGGAQGPSNGTDVHQNSISGNRLGGILDNDAGSIDATQNWWGAASGPSGSGPGTGDSVGTNVGFDPWLTCAPGGTCSNQAPQAAFSATPSSTPGSLQVSVDGTASTDDGTIASYAWDFGDNATATGATASHTYAFAGTYTITLTVTDNQGATGTTSHQVTVPAVSVSPPPPPPPANKAPQASFAFSPPIVPGGLQVSVDGSGSVDSDGTIASYAWSFGDGASATGATASHTYAAAGTYTITLTVTDNQGAKGTSIKQVTLPITPPPPPPPVKGVSVDVLPFSGTVLVNGKPLVAGQQIPFGAIVDTTHGTVLLESISPSGTLDAAYFAGAVFQLLKTPAGLTELLLQGGDFSVCTQKAKRRAAVAGQPPKKKTVVRSLWGNGHGQFVTKGRYAAATVRGTIWNTQDRCDGTFVDVQRGIVSVQDTVRNKTTSVTAGHTILVKP